MFDWLDRPNPPPCDHSHRLTTEYLRDRALPTEPTLGWLKANGGYCDCEVMFNVTDKWGERIGWEPANEDEDA
ncbi:MAG: DUF2695 domain-containing protein [Planctomycetaceae bacterium]|nr:DUF2695 domain-containing protein [Planctomycetaceae bacterium]